MFRNILLCFYMTMHYLSGSYPLTILVPSSLEYISRAIRSEYSISTSNKLLILIKHCLFWNFWAKIEILLHTYVIWSFQQNKHPYFAYEHCKTHKRSFRSSYFRILICSDIPYLYNLHRKLDICVYRTRDTHLLSNLGYEYEINMFILAFFMQNKSELWPWLVS